MVRTFLKVYMELGSYFLFLQEQIKDIIIVAARMGVLALGVWLQWERSNFELSTRGQRSCMLRDDVVYWYLIQ